LTVWKCSDISRVGHGSHGIYKTIAICVSNLCQACPFLLWCIPLFDCSFQIIVRKLLKISICVNKKGLIIHHTHAIYDCKLAWQGNIVTMHIFFAYSAQFLVPSASIWEFIVTRKTNTHLFKLSAVLSCEWNDTLFYSLHYLWNMSIKQCKLIREFWCFVVFQFPPFSVRWKCNSNSITTSGTMYVTLHDICATRMLTWYFSDPISVQINEQQLQHSNFAQLTTAKQHKKDLSMGCIDCVLAKQILIAVPMSKYRVTKFSTTQVALSHTYAINIRKLSTDKLTLVWNTKFGIVTFYRILHTFSYQLLK